MCHQLHHIVMFISPKVSIFQTLLTRIDIAQHTYLVLYGKEYRLQTRVSFCFVLGHPITSSNNLWLKVPYGGNVCLSVYNMLAGRLCT